MLFPVSLAGGDPLPPFVVGKKGPGNHGKGHDAEEEFHGHTTDTASLIASPAPKVCHRPFKINQNC